MAIRGPAFVGRITISSSNNRIDWYEENVGPGYDLNTTVTTGVYWPDTLATAIATAMTTESGSSGAGLTYTASWSNNGVLSLTSDAGSWYPKLTTSESNKILTGGDVSAGQVGDNHMGWTVDSSSPSGATVHAADKAHANGAYPVDARGMGVIKEEDDEGNRQSFSISMDSLGGTTQTYCFAPTARGEDPTRVRNMQLSMITQASREQWDDEFWHPYAKQGLPDGRFRYLNDRSDRATYTEYGLVGDSLKTPGFERATKGLPWWNLRISMKRYQT